MKELAKQEQGKIQIYGMDPEDELVQISALASVIDLDSALTYLAGGYTTSDRELETTWLIAGAWAWRRLVDGNLVPQVELAQLSTFGAKKYSLHPQAPNSWVTLSKADLSAAMMRHLSKALAGEEHIEVIDKDCTSCDVRNRGFKYRGHHETAVLWQASRLLALRETT